jgi:hypothetical protein
LKRDNLTLLGGVAGKWRQRGSKMAERVTANRFVKLDAFPALVSDDRDMFLLKEFISLRLLYRVYRSELKRNIQLERF